MLEDAKREQPCYKSLGQLAAIAVWIMTSPYPGLASPRATSCHQKSPLLGSFAHVLITKLIDAVWGCWRLRLVAPRTCSTSQRSSSLQQLLFLFTSEPWYCGHRIPPRPSCSASLAALWLRPRGLDSLRTHNKSERTGPRQNLHVMLRAASSSSISPILNTALGHEVFQQRDHT